MVNSARQAQTMVDYGRLGSRMECDKYLVTECTLSSQQDTAVALVFRSEAVLQVHLERINRYRARSM